MGTLLHFKDIYTDAFDDLKPGAIKIILKGYSVFCAIMLSMAFYAFMYRVFTGFDF